MRKEQKNMAKNTDQNGKSKKLSVVVVGVDGSAGAKAALRWALAEARLRNSPVRAVHAWTFGYIGGSVEGYPYWGGSIGSYTSLGVDLNDLHRAAEGLLERAIADVGTETEGIEIERQVVQGPAAEVLVEAASPRDLLVVGSPDTAASPASCSALSASNASITRSVRSSSSTHPSQRRLAASRLPAHKLARRPDSAT